MTVVPENLRMAELRRLGASAPLMQLAAGECICEVFRTVCLGPPHYVYQGALAPVGSPWIPLWSRDTRITGLRERPNGVEFIEFSVEDPREFELLASTEQGFWVTRFDALYENDVPEDVLQSAAATVGFRYLHDHLVARKLFQAQQKTFRDHRPWLQALVVSIDRRVTKV